MTTAQQAHSAAYVAVKIEPTQTKEVFRKLGGGRHVKQLHVVSGRYDLLLYMEAPDQDTLFHAIVNEIRLCQGVRDTETWLVLPRI